MARKPKKLTLNSRYRGALVGVLAGDALGAPYETWSAEKIAADFKARGGLTLFDYPDPWNKGGVFPLGRPTDDSDHTATLAQSVCTVKGVDEEDIFYRLRKVILREESILWSGKAVGVGKTTKTMLRQPSWEASKALGVNGAFPSNGSLMRSAPLGLFFGSHERVNIELVRRASYVTHRHEQAIECCIAYVIILASILDGTGAYRGTRVALPLVTDKALQKTLLNPFETPIDPERWPYRGAALLTLHIALWSLLTSGSFAEGIEKCIALGGDTDTYAAVAGGLLGAKFGIGDIPRKWREKLLGVSTMERLAERLLALSKALAER